MLAKNRCPILIYTSVLLIGFGLAGCSKLKTIYVPAGEPVRLRATIKAADVWVRDAKGDWVAGNVDLPEGWYCLADPGK